MGKVYVSADWHGCADPALKVLEFLKPDDRLYYLGDAADRGEEGVHLMTLLLQDPRVTYIKGNHEDLMKQALPDLIEGHDSYEALLWFSNGGRKTWSKMEFMSDESKMWYVDKIKTMPLRAVYRSPLGHEVILEHAGYSPFVMPMYRHDPLWDREHFYDEVWDGGFRRDERDPETTYLVHGHTPVQYLQFEYGYGGQEDKKELLIGSTWDSPEVKYKPDVLRYCDNHKFDVDLCTIVSGRIALLDLDTFEVIYFDKDE